MVILKYTSILIVLLAQAVFSVDYRQTSSTISQCHLEISETEGCKPNFGLMNCSSTNFDPFNLGYLSKCGDNIYCWSGNNYAAITGWSKTLYRDCVYNKEDILSVACSNGFCCTGDMKKILCIDKNNSKRGLIAGRYETMRVGRTSFDQDSEIVSQYGKYNSMCGLDHRTAQLDCFIINDETTTIINILTETNVRAMDHNNNILCFIHQTSGKVYCTKLDNLTLSELTIDDVNYNLISISKDIDSNLVCLGGDNKISCYYWDEHFSLAPVFYDSNVLNQSYLGLDLPSNPCVINNRYEIQCF